MPKNKAAEAKKTEGGKLFSAGKLDEALAAFTEAIELDDKQAAYPANRALVYIKKKDFAAAEKDCDTAIGIDPKNAKVSFKNLLLSGLAWQK